MMFHVVYNNMTPPSDNIRALIGIDNFGALLFRRRTLLNWLQTSAQSAGLAPVIELQRPADRMDLDRRLRNGEWGDHLFLVCPSHVVSSKGYEAVTLFLRQAVYSPGGMLLPAEGGADWSGWLLLTAPLLREYLHMHSEGDLPGFVDQHGRELLRARDRMSLIDINDDATLLKFLGGAFDLRFFNSIERSEYILTKRSTDQAKLEREFRFFDLLPPRMQMFFIRPFDFEMGNGWASYRMERLHVPDMALQWLHGALGEAEFARFMDRIFNFISTRERRAADKAEVDKQFQSLFIDKVRDRLELLTTLPEYNQLRPLLEPVFGTVHQLAERYLDLLHSRRARFPRDHLVIGHGDLCFSNILYSKSAQVMKLIDARGASSEADLWTHPYYDIAKLSHSVLGNYDCINQDMFDVLVSECMNLRLALDRESPDWARAMFLDRVERSGFDRELVRLCEASLFISMLPLHIDRPRKVLGFGINAANILDALENGQKGTLT
jgi:hypothetical protein